MEQGCVLYGILVWTWTGTPVVNHWLPQPLEIRKCVLPQSLASEGMSVRDQSPAAPPRDVVLPLLAVAKLGDVVVATLQVSQRPPLVLIDLPQRRVCADGHPEGAVKPAHSWRVRIAAAPGPDAVLGVVFATVVVAATAHMESLPTGVRREPSFDLTRRGGHAAFAGADAGSALLIAHQLSILLADGGPPTAPGVSFAALLAPIVQRDAAMRAESAFTSTRVLAERTDASGLAATREYDVVPPTCGVLAPAADAAVRVMRATVTLLGAVVSQAACDATVCAHLALVARAKEPRVQRFRLHDGDVLITAAAQLHEMMCSLAEVPLSTEAASTDVRAGELRWAEVRSSNVEADVIGAVCALPLEDVGSALPGLSRSFLFLTLCAVGVERRVSLPLGLGGAAHFASSVRGWHAGSVDIGQSLTGATLPSSVVRAFQAVAADGGLSEWMAAVATPFVACSSCDGRRTGTANPLAGVSRQPS